MYRRPRKPGLPSRGCGRYDMSGRLNSNGPRLHPPGGTRRELPIAFGPMTLGWRCWPTPPWQGTEYPGRFHRYRAGGPLTVTFAEKLNEF